MRLLPLLLPLLAGCPGPSTDDSGADSGDSGGDSGDSAADSGGGDSGDSGGGDSGDSGGGDSGGDSGDSGAETLADAYATFVGSASDAAGATVLLPGDLDGDGNGDVVVGAYYGNRVCWFAGPVAAGSHALDASSGCLEGEGSYDFAAYAMAGVGDLDGDGAAELLVGAVGNGENGANAGKVYLVRDPGEGGALADSVATWIGEASGDYAGIGLGGPGDLTGDGVPDLVIGASGSDAGGAGGGRAYVVPGPVEPGAYLLSDVATTVSGEATALTARAHGSLGGGDLVGDSLDGSVDLDGDGLADLVLGAGGNASLGPSTGAVAVFFGPIPAAHHSLYEADVLLYGAYPGSYTGSPVTPAGDLTGDGRADLLVAADGVSGGSVYLVPGGMEGGSGSIGDTRVRFTGEYEGDQAGAGLAGTGDLSGDGVPDVAIGAPASDRGGGQDTGVVYVVYGPFADGTIALAGADRILPGEVVADNAGRAVAGGADATGDGLPDLLVGALYNDEGGAFAGKAYLFVGR